MFIHLRTYSDYSLLLGMIKVNKLVEKAINNKMPAIALTDFNNLYGSLEFSEYAAKNGLQPIIGCDLKIQYKQQDYSILLLVQNGAGYKNLLQILYDNSCEQLSLNQLKSKTKGLIALTGDILKSTLLNMAPYMGLVEDLLSLFPGNLYVELQRCSDDDNKIEDQLIKIAHQYNIPMVATNQVLFTDRGDHEAHDALTCIATGSYISDQNRIQSNSMYYFRSSQEMRKLFADIPEAISNTVTIARRCSFMVEAREPTLPRFPCEIDESQEITRQSHAGLKERLKGEIPTSYQKRLEYELQVITNMQYSGYFLIVSDFIKWSKNNDIPVGPGRGSGVGSIVAWALQITDLDPIKFGLLFERFLNPDRISMPDFDIDFCQEKRDQVIKYIQKRYGHIAQIITFGKLQPRAVLRDVGRVLQIPYFQVDKICKLIPHNPVNPVTLSEAINLDKELQKARDNDETIRKLLTIGLKLEGLHRHASTHAAGIVISSEPLINIIPISYDQTTQLPISQYSMKYVEKAGLVKFDFLGLKTLTVIDKTCQLIGNDFNMNDVSLDDKATFDLLGAGDSVGVFQLENAFMRQTLKKLQPDSFDDIVALISLNRPGPMDNIPTYIARKHGQEDIKYIHPKLEETLQDTFGVVIYQEQVMEIAKVLAGYTLGQADLLRRAMGKKIKQEMDMQRDIFVKGAEAGGISKNQAANIFNLVAKFAGYGFNKSHAAAYAIISYHTAYLKANYPVEFLTASMNLDIHDTDKLQLFCNEAKQHNIKILSPDINKSQAYFMVESRAIRYGLGALKSVGIAAINKLSKKPYKDIWDFSHNTDLNKRCIESLAKAGAFDTIHNNRQQICKSAERIAHAQKDDDNMQGSLFGNNMHFHLSEVGQWNHADKLQYEFESIGFFLKDHPIDQYKNILSDINTQLDGIIFGIITKVRMRSSSRGKFSIMSLSHPDGIYDIAFYDHDLIEQNIELFAVGQAVAMQVIHGENGIRGTSINNLEKFISLHLLNIIIYVHDQTPTDKLPTLFREQGNTKVIIRIRSDDTEIDIELPQAYNIDIKKIIELDGLTIMSE